MELSKGHLGEVFENVLVERNIVDFADFRMDRPGADEPTVRFLYVGKVTVAKGVAFLLQCLASLPPHLSFEAHIVGNGDAEQSLREAYRTDGRIHFHGLCNRQEVVAHYQRASVLAVPSLWFEPAGLVIYQAQVAGLPVVASDSGGIPELLGGRSDSLVLAAGDAGSWTSRLRSLIEDPSLLRQMREAASRHASEYQGAIDSGANRVVDFCRSIMSSAPTSEVSRQ
jgi:glycosyltransferase involved in cell wall biosynthesis